MIKLLVKFALNGLAIIGAANLLPGISVDTFWTAMVAGIVLALLNTIVKPIFVMLSLPITILTFGLFLIFINGFIVLIAEHFLAGFHVQDIWWAIAFSFIVSVFNYILESFFGLR